MSSDLSHLVLPFPLSLTPSPLSQVTLSYHGTCTWGTLRNQRTQRWNNWARFVYGAQGPGFSMTKRTLHFALVPSWTQHPDDAFYCPLFYCQAEPALPSALCLVWSVHAASPYPLPLPYTFGNLKLKSILYLTNFTLLFSLNSSYLVSSALKRNLKLESILYLTNILHS
jgi:hypothetical protein